VVATFVYTSAFALRLLLLVRQPQFILDFYVYMCVCLSVCVYVGELFVAACQPVSLPKLGFSKMERTNKRLRLKAGTRSRSNMRVKGTAIGSDGM